MSNLGEDDHLSSELEEELAEFAGECARALEIALGKTQRNDTLTKRTIWEARRNRKGNLFVDLNRDEREGIKFQGGAAFDVPIPPLPVPAQENESTETVASSKPNLVEGPAPVKSSMFWPWK